MVRPLLLLTVCLAAGYAVAAADRYVVEDAVADGGVRRPGTDSAEVLGQSAAYTFPASCTSQSCSRAAPSGCEEGLLLGNVGSFRVDVEATTVLADAGIAGATFAGGGTLDFWVYDPDAPLLPDAGCSMRWSHVLGYDQSMSGASGAARVSFPNFLNSWRVNGARLVVRPNAVTTNGDGGTISTAIRACVKDNLGGCAP